MISKKKNSKARKDTPKKNNMYLFVRLVKIV